MALPATLLDLPSKSEAAKVLYSNTIKHQQPNAEEPHLAEDTEIQAKLATLTLHCRNVSEIFVYKSSAAWDANGKAGSLAGRALDLTPPNFVKFGSVKTYVYFVQIQLLSDVNEMMEQTIAAVSTETLENQCKNYKFQNSSQSKVKWWT